VGFGLGLALREHGIFARPLGDVIVLMPPLTSTDQELEHLAASVCSVVTARFPA
jgi:lysine--8-amino-7-oxononanoate aminotransferase